MVRPGDGRWWTLTAVCLAVFALLVNVTIVTVALPEIERSLGTGFTTLRWIVSGYALALATLLLGTGSLADLFGHRRVFLSGLWLFLFASAACGAAGSAGLLVGARIAQGVAAALLLASGLALIARAFPGRERARALGVWGATVGIATSVGPLLGGALVELGSWRWIFFVNVPVVLLAIALVVARVERDAGAERARVDWTGQALAAAGLFLLVYGLTDGGEHGWDSPRVLVALTGAGALLAVFGAVELRVRAPMLDPRLLGRRGILGAALAGFSMHACFFTLFVFLAVYLQSVLGYSALEAGLALVPTALANALGALLAGRLAATLPLSLRVAGGLALICGGVLLMHGLHADSSWRALLVGSVLGGLGVGIANPAILGAALATIEPGRSGIASALNVTFRQLGTAVGIAGLGTLLQLEAASRAGGTFGFETLRAREAYASALDDVLLVAAGGIALGLLAALVLLRGAREPTGAAGLHPTEQSVN